MSTSVKISEDAKRLLEKLQARIVLSTGKRPSQEEILDTIVELSTEKEEEVIARMAGLRFPFSPREVDALMKIPLDWSVKTKEEEINKVLYGETSEGR